MPSRFLSAITGLCFAVLPLLPASAFAANDTIVVGQSIDLSGPNAALGRDYVAGIKTCFDAVNAAGGVNGRRIQFIVRDDHGDPAQSARTAGELLERDQADYLFGGVGDATTRAILDSPAFRRSGQILFGPLAQGEFASSAHVLFWRPTFQQEIRHIFEHFSTLGMNDVGIVYQDTPANVAAYRWLTTEISERHMKLIGTAKIGPDGENAAAEARRLAAAKPGFIVMVSDTIGAALFLKEYRRNGGHSFVAGTSLINLETLRELAGAPAMEWTVFSQVVPNPAAASSPLQLEHLNTMRKYRDEAVSALTLEGFAAARTLVRAMQRSKNGRQALQSLVAQPAQLDLGGLVVSPVPGGNRLSSYVDIALFKKGVLLF